VTSFDALLVVVSGLVILFAAAITVLLIASGEPEPRPFNREHVCTHYDQTCDICGKVMW
jgi:hypothetical protein